MKKRWKLKVFLIVAGVGTIISLLLVTVAGVAFVRYASSSWDYWKSSPQIAALVSQECRGQLIKVFDLSILNQQALADRWGCLQSNCWEGVKPSHAAESCNSHRLRDFDGGGFI